MNPMAARKSLSPVLQLLLAAAASFDLPHQRAACHALHRQAPLTMLTAFPPSNTSNANGTALLSYTSPEQCLDVLDKEGEAALAAVSSSKGLGSSISDDQLHRRGEAQRCLLPSRGSLMRQQQQLGPEAGEFPCASKRVMAAAPPPATLQSQRQQLHGQQQPRQLQLGQHQAQQQLEQQLRQRRPGRQQNQPRHEDVATASNVAFDWRNSPHSPGAAFDSSEDVLRLHVVGSTSNESPAAVLREKVAGDASIGHAAASGEGKQKMSFFEAVGHAVAAEAAALVGGTWDWSTWGIGGLRSTFPTSARVKQTTGADASSATRVTKRTEANGGSAAASAADAAKDTAEALAAGTVATELAGVSTSKLAGAEDVASVVAAPPAAPASAGDAAAVAAVQNTAATPGQRHSATAESEAHAKSYSSGSDESSWWGGKTWADAIGSFFKKLDQRIEDAQGMLSHSDLYEFTL